MIGRQQPRTGEFLLQVVAGIGQQVLATDIAPQFMGRLHLVLDKVTVPHQLCRLGFQLLLLLAERFDGDIGAVDTRFFTVWRQMM